MRHTFRMKLMLILGIASAAFAALILVGAQLERRAGSQLHQIAQHYGPQLELGPRLTASFERLVRALREAIALHDANALDATRAARDDLLTQLERAQQFMQAEQWVALRAASRAYYTAASVAGQRMLAANAPTLAPEALADLEDKRREVERLLHEATALDQRALTNAFAEAARAHETARSIRLLVSVCCLALVLMVCLGLSRSVLRAVGAIGDGIARFGRGSFETPIPVLSNDEFGMLAQQANQMATSLRELLAQQERSAWLAAGANGLQQALRGELDPEAVAERALYYLARYLEAPAAVLYGAEAGGDLHLLAHYGARSDEGSGPPERFAPGSSLLGRAALTQELTVLAPVPKGYFQ
ncbi:MAG TPA: HAMP domain-containing protein, partial [Polyangiales bacterium]